MYVTIRPVNPTLYRKINFYVTYMLNSQVVFVVEWWSGSRSFIYTDPAHVKDYFGKEHALLLLNHGCEVDWLMGWVICDRVGVLGNARVYAKRILQYAPVLGWSWKFQEIVFLDRDWEKDRRNMGAQLTRLAAYPDPIWLTLFPEGTRFTQEKYEASMEVAREKGLPLLKHHLLPRTKGFVASIPYLKGKVPAIYDVVVVVEKGCKNEPSVFSLVRGEEVRTELLIRRIPMSEVPDDEKEAAAWLQKLFQDKDKVLDNYVKLGEFVPKNERDSEEYSSYKNYQKIELPRRYYSLINFCSWAALILIPLGTYLCQTMLSGSIIRISVVAILCASAYIGFNNLINLTRIDKGSTYGSTGPTPSTNGVHNNGSAKSDKPNGIGMNGSTKVESKLD
ncbi:1-acyl-sn-glycerol-3-phosphate acyltransferase gamma [Folsomia candida]|uniref:1-acyl-sn-glycerol-3-phosphate acyltransferase gamma n=2 Tax=Folsomia candida TaxID=158441 RepID=A0A226DZI5_FOLCA|nr:1-acyl-sn-glycerol-3-phosphate acyltransferase gamma [Folsomia candida]